VTESTEGQRCGWCGRPLAPRRGPGRPRRYCKQSCRQRDYESRLRSREVGLSEAELIITRQSLQSVFDAAYVLEAALEDVDRDLAADDSPDELRRSLDWLRSSAQPLLSVLLKLQ